MNASILIVGHPYPHTIEFGADHAPTYDGALKQFQTYSYPVVVISNEVPISKTNVIKESFDLFKKIRKISLDTQLIWVGAELTPQKLKNAINEAGVFKILKSFDSSELQLSVHEALEEFELIKQNHTFLELLQEQNKQLQNLQFTLEEKVRARQAYLSQSTKKLAQTIFVHETLKSVFVATQKSQTLIELEKKLMDALKKAVKLSSIEIRFLPLPQQDKDFEKKLKTHITFSIPLFHNQKHTAQVYFFKKSQQEFLPDEESLLIQMNQVLALSVERLRSLIELEAAKKEWDITFDSLTEPLALINENYEIIRANETYASYTGERIENLNGKICYKTLFGQNSPCENCQFGQNFILSDIKDRNKKMVSFSVSSNPISLKNESRAYAFIYQNITGEQKIQRQILETSKMAEIGTIGSSIAHEINNPLGGIIAFLQILKSETQSDGELHGDVIEMEGAALRCKSIVENLLAFTRLSSSEKMQKIKLQDIIKLVVNIIEIQTKSRGIQIKQEHENDQTWLEVNTNQIVQVLVNILQNSVEAIQERLAHGQILAPGKIMIKTSLDVSSLRIEIQDNGIGIPSENLQKVFTPFFTTKNKTNNPGLGLSVSLQIIKDHQGALEISSPNDTSTIVTVTLPLPKV